MADKALLIGINDYQTVGVLRGCENDVKNMQELLTNSLGFNPRNVKTLLSRDATKRNITDRMRWLFQSVRAGDRLVLHFSGHGSYTALDKDGDEDRGTDELLCLVDMDFRNSDTFIVDDELRNWTAALPQNARLLVVLDCCHSGTGTRLVSRSVTEAPQAIIEEATATRLIRGSREMFAAAEVASRVREVFDPANEQAVLARFVPPPPEIARRIEARKRSARRSLRRAVVAADLNHILLAGCRDDQTAADAWIDDNYHGAFTYQLCKVLRGLGNNAGSVDRSEIHRQVVGGLRQGHFPQEPQFEGPEGPGTLFGDQPDPSLVPAEDPWRSESTGSHRPPTGGLEPHAYSLLERIVGSGVGLTVEDRRKALDILDKLVGDGRRLAVGERATGTRYLVYVHGICVHPPGYSNPWWQALQPHVNGVFGSGQLGRERREVQWSDLVNTTRSVLPQADPEREAFRRELLETLQDRYDEYARQATTRSADRVQPRDLDAGTRGLGWGDCIDDFTIYMTDESVRIQVLERFTRVVRPLLEEGAQVDLIAHSWGAVVAYEGLRELEDAGFTSSQVRTLFTVGGALAIPPVRWRLRPANKDGRKPAPVRRWVNLDAQGDVVGGALKRHFRVDDEFLDLEPVGCTANWWGFYDASCAHGAYFNPANEKVNKHIFGLFIVG